ncbi:MAG: DUF711 family protein [Anaerolineae bacterium]|nr:DUF711 family protein [Anaerolineae bacterium]
MRIRSITYLIDPGYPLDADRLEQAGVFVAQAQQAFTSTGYEVQTARLATIPFPRLLPDLKPETAIPYAQTLERMAAEAGCSYVALGPALPDCPESYALVPQVLAETENVFLSGVIAASDGDTALAGISLPAIRACAEVIHHAATLDPDGFGNLYFCALANVPPGGPFFPAAYHGGGAPCFALAMEAADLAVTAFTQAGTLAEARQNLIESIERHAERLARVSDELEAGLGVAFGGLDLTLAPYPTEAQSLGTAIERLGVPAVGLHGSLAGAAFIADALDRARYPKVGFNGLMLPLLEDSTLALRAEQGTLTLKDLLMYSAVCGTGLDTVPLPGDVSVDALAAILLDVAALAQRLAKPLTARLMPIPGKRAGEPTAFDFPYFANSHVLSVEAEPLYGLWAGHERLPIEPREMS